ncbi:MAG TPA: NrfD/PsrC family molybdoenzyme membrane anchor subunit [Solirubrobacteraceae bacterium]|jgi:formate-dependent nitrite reductase membrane component NrfD|nr:NrfD/PsrC family molybdoenzyme membrane anchor subunit [Solirubrobacteraceae bacterium]
MSSAGPETVPRADSYYGRGVIKAPVWTKEIPCYFFIGGLAGASGTFAFLSERRHPRLARRAWLTSLAGLVVSPALLISDLGRPARFLNMLRMFKITSPMSVGSWVLAGSGAATAGVGLQLLSGRFRWLARVCRPIAGTLGLPLATYTGALLAQTAVPVWHEARRELPALFAAGAAASAGAAATVLAPIDEAAPARRLALVGAAAELALAKHMEDGLHELAGPYREGPAAAYSRAASALVSAGALIVAVPARRSRPAAVAGGALLLAGAFCARWSVFKAGFDSARDPGYTVGPQRRRVSGGRGHGASRHAPAA